MAAAVRSRRVTGRWEGVRPAKAGMMVCMNVADPDALQASNDPVSCCAIAAPQLSVGPLPAVQQHPTLQAPQCLLLCCFTLLLTQQEGPMTSSTQVTVFGTTSLIAAPRLCPIWKQD